MAVPGCLFYDANILFDLLSGRLVETLSRQAPKNSRYQNAKRVLEIAQKLGIPRFASSLTYNLLERRIREVTDFTGDAIKSLIVAIKAAKLIDSSGKLERFDAATDLFIVENFVWERFKRIPSNRDWEKESLLLLEQLIVENVEDVHAKHTQSVETQKVLDNLVEALRQFGEISDARKTELAKLKLEVPQVEMTVDPPTLFMLKHKVGMMDDEDLAQLAVALQQQRQQNRWTIVVSTDYRDIINARTPLFQSLRLMCSGPLYATTHLRTLNREVGPMPYPDKMSYVT